MRHPASGRCAFRRASAALTVLVATLCALAGCGKLKHTADTQPLDQAGMYFNSVQQLQSLGVTDAEVQQLVPVRQSGASDETCIDLIRIAHDRHQPFSDGQAVADLAGAGFAEASVVELARLNQLGPWAGEAQVLRLAGLSDAVVLEIARRRAANQPVLSSAKVSALRNAGLSEKEIMDQIDKGATDADADAIITQRVNAAGGHSFVHQHGRHR